VCGSSEKAVSMTVAATVEPVTTGRARGSDHHAHFV
jgi:hypothetical protein